MSDDVDRVVAFGGLADGRPFHPHADPPFGYRVKEVIFKGKTRKLFVYAQLKDSELDRAVLQSALRRLDGEAAK